MVRFLMCAALALVLAGCSGSDDVARIPETPTPGGGGETPGGGGGDLSSKLQSYADGQPTLQMTAEEIVNAANSLTSKMTHRVSRGSSAFPCDGDCSPPDTFLAGENFKTVPVLAHNGVSVSKIHSPGFTLRDEDEIGEYGNFTYYHAWLDYSAFSVQELHCLSGWCEPGHYKFEDAMGAYSQTNPVGIGSATWTGLMIGMKDGIDDTLYAGDARITVDDLANPDVDVSFTDIQSEKGDSVADMSWQDIPVNKGVFRTGPDYDKDYLGGMFTGPSHQEVVGTFRQIGIIGSFGAKKQ